MVPIDHIVVVSGLPRSGTSLMMKMLWAGGFPLMVDNVRRPDEDNPEGYFELERVKKLSSGDIAWLSEACGKAIKIVSPLLRSLPSTYSYRVIFMKRHLGEVLASQRRMLARHNEPVDPTSDQELAEIFTKHLRQVETWLAGQPNFVVLTVDYNLLIADPRPLAEQVNAFLGGTLDVSAMCKAVNPQLYRNRVAATQDAL